MTYEGHYPGCTSHPDHEGDCTVARSLPARESVGKIRLEALGLNPITGLREASLATLHEAELTMFQVAKDLSYMAVEYDAIIGLATEEADLKRNLLGERLRVLAARLLIK